jgi:diguanylate cyclase (GGDEF)-like protein
MLLALVSMPLGVLSLQLYGELRQADEERATVQEIVPLTELRLESIDLRAALSDERTWSIAALGVERFGVDPEVVKTVIGIDIVERYEQAQEATDEIIADFEHLHDQLERLRGNRISNLQIAGGYESLSEQVDDMGRDAARSLQARVRARADADELLRQLTVAEAAADAQLAVNGMFVGSIASRFVESTGDPGSELQSLVQHRRAYTSANERIDEVIRSGEVAEALHAIRSSPTERRMLALVDDQIDSALEDGLDPATGELFTVAIDDLAELEEFLGATETSTAAWIDLTRAAGAHLAATAQDLADDASARIDRTRSVLFAIGAFTLFATVVVAAVLSRAIRRLARAAQALRDGESTSFSPSGPKEVEIAGEAIHEASSNFELLRRQASALASGHLSHPDLALTAPGQLGETFRRVVDTLSGSIHAQQLAQEDAAWRARHDGLTGLPNRSAAIHDLREMLEGPAASELAVMIVDLDGFKDVNDGHGHPAGDEVLVHIAQRLRSCRLRGHEAYRLGGDEFVILAPDTGRQSEARRIAHQVLEDLSAPVVLGNGTRVSVSCSVGVAMAEVGSTDSGLLKSADVAVYEAKTSGRKRVVLCTPALLEASNRATQTSAELVRAIRENQLRLEYQPIVDTEGGVIALETLIRWDHPHRGLVAPDNFIPIAERSDLIIDIDRWVLGEVANQLAAWSAAGGLLGGMPVAVNLSTRHLNAASLFDDVIGPLRECNVDPARLSVEITETALLAEAEDARRNLDRLRAEGVSIAVDDFGTGYSAITQLRIFPVDVIKIDRSFTSQVTDESSYDRTLMQMIIDVAHLLGAQIVTEGVESAEQASALVAMGSDALQGWYFSPSVRPEDLTDLLRSVPWDPSTVVER